MLDRGRFVEDLRRFVGFKTVVCDNPAEFDAANRWIRSFFDPTRTEFVDFDCHGLTSTLVKPKDSDRPRVLGDGHIEVVPGDDALFTLREGDGRLWGRGVADMKTQCLMMIYVLRDLIAEGRHNDFWLLLSEDEEVGSAAGVAVVADYLDREGLFPEVVFAPDGGPDFAYVEKEKGIMSFSARIEGEAAHASRPYLGINAIDSMTAFYADLKDRFPNPRAEEEWEVSLSMTTIEGGEASNKIPQTCKAGFDLRLTEKWEPRSLVGEIEDIAGRHGAEIDVRQADPAVYYPKEAPIAIRYLEILRDVSGKEPRILHSAGASNGRLYVAKRPDLHVLMSNPTVGGAHADAEWLDPASLEPYYRLARETALL